jgi:hypothetical protein
MWDVPILGFAPVVLGAVCGFLLYSKLPATRGTTLGGPWCWLMGTVALTTIASLAEPLAENSVPDTVKYMLAMASFCPQMALLGARRPQHRGWAFIVATFWLVLALPAFEVWLTRPGQSIEAAAARSMLLLVLLGVSLGNLAPTTHRFAGIAIVFGQWLLIAPWISYAGYDLPAADYWGRTICLAGLLAALLRPRREYPGASEFDRVWLAYRDLFGGLWALRIAERFNAYLAERPKADGSEDSAQVTLRLGGLTTLDGQPAPAEAASDEDWLAFNNLLRRFVCDDWVHARKEPRIR